MARTWKIGIAGLGTVGGGLITFLADRPDFAPAGGKAFPTLSAFDQADAIASVPTRSRQYRRARSQNFGVRHV